MKKALTISLVATIVFATMNNALVYLAFKINQSEIAKTLCINRDQPTLHCDGKCVLSERLAENNDREASSAPFTKLEETLRLTLFCQVLSEQPAATTAAAYQHSFVYTCLFNQTTKAAPSQPPEPFSHLC